MKINMDDLTLGEIEAIEDRFGCSFEEARQKSIGKLARGVAFTALVREGRSPDEAWDEAGDIKMVDMTGIFDDDDVDPTDAPD